MAHNLSAQTALLRTFDNCTLQDNWCEDRLMAPDEVRYNDRKKTVRPYEPETTIFAKDGSTQYQKPLTDAPYHQRHVLGPTPKNRILPWDSDHVVYNTTLKDSMTGEMPFKAPRQRRPMVTAGNLHKQINIDRSVPGVPTKGFGSTLGSGMVAEPKPSFETTYQYNYITKPSEARSKPPFPEQGDDTRHLGGYPSNINPNTGAIERGPIYSKSNQFFRVQKWERDAYDTTKAPEQPRGRAGARGELVRNPEAGGSVQGRSVWLDEYSTMGLQTAGASR